MKRVDEMDAVVREVVERRDKALSNGARLSSARRSALNTFVARYFPVATMLHEVVVTRDKTLHQGPVTISAAVESTLIRQLAAAEPTPAATPTAWLNRLRSPLAAVLAASVLITVALVGLGRWEISRSNARSVPPGPMLETIRLESGMEAFVPTIAIGPSQLRPP